MSISRPFTAGPVSATVYTPEYVPAPSTRMRDPSGSTAGSRPRSPALRGHRGGGTGDGVRGGLELQRQRRHDRGRRRGAEASASGTGGQERGREQETGSPPTERVPAALSVLLRARRRRHPGSCRTWLWLKTPLRTRSRRLRTVGSRRSGRRRRRSDRGVPRVASGRRCSMTVMSMRWHVLAVGTIGLPGEPVPSFVMRAAPGGQHARDDADDRDVGDEACACDPPLRKGVASSPDARARSGASSAPRHRPCPARRTSVDG